MYTRVVTFTDWIVQSERQIKTQEKDQYDGFHAIKVEIEPRDDTKTIQWNFIGLNDNDQEVVDLYWYDSGEEITIPTDTTMTKWYLWGRYNTNEPIDPSDVVKMTATMTLIDKWYAAEGQYPMYPEHIAWPPVLYSTQPYGTAVWRIEEDANDGYPYIIFFPLIERIHYNPVKQRDIITVYDHRSTKADLLTNGLAILEPTSAVIHEVMNGEWTLTLTHPCDETGKWKYIRENNLVKCCGQLYTIKRLEWNLPTANTGEITATCEHVFYQLCDMWVYASNWGFTDNGLQESYWYNCKQAISAIMSSAVTDDDSQDMIRYAYEWESDWEFTIPWCCIINETGTTPVELLLGTNGIIGSMGGELYRDNFYFSIQSRMESAKDDAFDIRIGENLCGVQRTVDVSQCATLLRLYEGHGSGFIAVSYDGRDAFPLFQWPHNITRSDSYTFPDDVFNKAVQEGRSLMEPLSQIAFARWRKNALPIVCYDITVKDVRQNPDFEGIEGYRFKVGDEGRIYDERLGGTIKLRITETETDGITGEVTRVVFGSKSSFTRGAAYPNSAEIQPSNVTGAKYLRDANYKRMIDANGKKLARGYTV